MEATIWNACTQDPNWIMRQIECHPALAGYIQAIGTVAAVGVAMAAPAIESFFSRRQAARDMRRRTLAFAEMLRPAMVEVQADVAKAQEVWNAWQQKAPQAHLWTEILNSLLIKIPPALQALGFHNDYDPELLRPQRRVYTAISNCNNTRLQIQGGYAAAVADWGNVWRMMSAALIEVENAVFLTP